MIALFECLDLFLFWQRATHICEKHTVHDIGFPSSVSSKPFRKNCYGNKQQRIEFKLFASKKSDGKEKEEKGIE